MDRGRYYTNEAAEILKIPEAKVIKLCDEGELDAVQVLGGDDVTRFWIWVIPPGPSDKVDSLAQRVWASLTSEPKEKQQ